MASISIPSDSWLECPPVQEVSKVSIFSEKTLIMLIILYLFQEQYRLKCNSPLSQDERRVHHVASEHKRRQSIRSGLKQLTEWVPHMKSIPHSKSTLLFKTADYIKRTEKRNRVLRDRLLRLQYRVAQELVQSQQQQPLLQQHEGLLHHRSAIIIPVEDEDDAPIIPCLNIPADEDFGQESLIRESLLCCGKLKLNR